MRGGATEHLRKHSLLYLSQHCFISKGACLTNLLEFLDDIAGMVDEGDLVHIVHLEAFDKVPHTRLGCKLTSNGIVGNINNLIEKCLCGRQQRVVRKWYRV